MLYKVFMSQYFREDPDSVGIIEALDIMEALDKLNAHIVESCLWDFKLTAQVDADPGGLAGTLTMTSTDEDDVTGTDVYQVEYQANGIWLFHAVEWERLFRSGERGGDFADPHR